jgi:hypothetical protein
MCRAERQIQQGICITWFESKRTGVQGGGDDILQHPPSLPFSWSCRKPGDDHSIHTLSSSTAETAMVAWSKESSHGTQDLQTMPPSPSQDICFLNQYETRPLNLAFHTVRHQWLGVAGTAGVPRYHKMQFLSSNGKGDPLVWTGRPQCNQFFWGQWEAYTLQWIDVLTSNRLWKLRLRGARMLKKYHTWLHEFIMHQGGHMLQNVHCVQLHVKLVKLCLCSSQAI